MQNQNSEPATSMLVPDVGDEMCRRQLWDVRDRFHRFCHQHPLSFNISVEHQQPKSVTNIEVLSLTSKNCHHDKVTNTSIHLSLHLCSLLNQFSLMASSMSATDVDDESTSIGHNLCYNLYAKQTGSRQLYIKLYILSVQIYMGMCRKKQVWTKYQFKLDSDWILFSH